MQQLHEQLPARLLHLHVQLVGGAEKIHPQNDDVRVYRLTLVEGGAVAPDMHSNGVAVVLLF